VMKVYVLELPSRDRGGPRIYVLKYGREAEDKGTAHRNPTVRAQTTRHR
jgi:hypothetical protein